MNTLIIYDNMGYIIQRKSGDVREPVGIPHMWVYVPEGKYVSNVDVTGETHEAVFEDLPKTTEDKLAEMSQSILEISMIIAGGAS